jgi:hypothetical protein
MRNGQVVREFLAEMAALDPELEAAGATLTSIRRPLADGLTALEDATEWLLARDDPNDSLAGATPYLELFGTVAGAWLLAKGAVAAVRALETGKDPFLRAKITTARFFCTQLLPPAVGLSPAILAGADDLFETDPEYLRA